MEALSEHARLARKGGPEMRVQPAGLDIGNGIEERPADHVVRREAGELLEPAVPAADHEGRVGREDALDGQLLEPPHHGGVQ